jgi:hypothetical protein
MQLSGWNSERGVHPAIHRLRAVERLVTMLFIWLWLLALKITFAVWPASAKDPFQPTWAHRRKREPGQNSAHIGQV